MAVGQSGRTVVFCLLIGFCSRFGWSQPIETDADKIRTPQRNGFFADIDIASIGEIEWTFKVKSGATDPTVANGMVYFVDESHNVYAKSAKGGFSIWNKNIKFRAFRKPVANRRHVFLGSDIGVVALRADNGDFGWSYSIHRGAGEMVIWPPTNTLFVSGSDGNIRALDAASGEEKWKTSLMDNIPADPEGFDGERARVGGNCRPSGIATDGETVYQNIFDQSRCVAVRAKDGKFQWSYQTKGWVGGTPSVDDKYCYVGSQDKHLYALDKKTGQMIWKFPTNSRVSEGPAVHDRSVVFASCDGGVYCVDRDSGKKLWVSTTDPDSTGRRFIYSKPIINNESVCIAAGEGQVYAFDLKTGKEQWRQRPMPISQCYCTPATDGTRIFVSTRPDWDDKGDAGIVALGPVTAE